MVLRLISRNLNEARIPREENPAQEENAEVRQDGRSPQATPDAAAGSPGLGSQKKKVVAADLALDWVLQEIVQQARLATTATGAFIGILRSRNIVCQAASGSNCGDFVAYLNRDRRTLDSCLNDASPYRCRDSETSEQLDSSTCRFLGVRSIVLVPIIDPEGAKLGVFGVFSPQVDAFSSANIVALQTLSHRICDAMAQVDRCTSVSAGAAAARLRTDLRKPAQIRGGALGARRRRLLRVTRPSVWILAFLAIAVLAGWFLSRNNRFTIFTSAKTPAVASSQTTKRLSSQPPTSPAASGDTRASSPVPEVAALKPVVETNSKPVTAPPSVLRTDKKSGARGTRIPNLEIENELDDAASEPLPSGPAQSLKSPAPSSSPAMPKPGQAGESNKKVLSATSVSSNPPSASPHLEITHPAPDSRTQRNDVSVRSSEAAPGASSVSANPDNPSPLMIPEESALQRLLDQVGPEQPVDKNGRPINGTVTLDVVVGKRGWVEGITPLNGDPRLLAAAQEAVSKWHFEPLLRDHNLLTFETHITLRFGLP